MHGTARLRCSLCAQETTWKTPKMKRAACAIIEEVMEATLEQIVRAALHSRSATRPPRTCEEQTGRLASRCDVSC